MILHRLYTTLLLLSLPLSLFAEGDNRRDLLSQRADSLSLELNINRTRYRMGTDSASIYRSRIIAIEELLFDTRAQLNLLPPQQTREVIAQTPEQPLSTESGVRSISMSQELRNRLSIEDINSLRAAQTLERKVELRARSYVSNYQHLSRLREEYAQCSSPIKADSIFYKFQRLDSINTGIAQLLERRYRDIVDTKNYTYALLMEQLGESDIFEREQRLKIEAVKMIDSLRKNSMSEEFLSYYATRIAELRYEVAVAQRLHLPDAVDSLRSVRDSLRIVGFNYPTIAIQKRQFIDYEPIKFSTKAIYTSSNPIPNGKIHPRGVIYRILVGSFKSRQAASLFRGAYPICIIKDKAGLLGYYIGSYETLSEAESARELLLKKGFRRPEVVEWRDGAATNLTRHPRAQSSKYRVEIEGTSEISAQLRGVISTQGAGRELSKVGATSFVVGTFDNKERALQLAESLKVMDERIKATVVEVK